MKNRLQALWDDAVPIGGACPQPEPEAVLQKIDTVLDGKPSAGRRRRFFRNAVVLAAVFLLLAAAALAVGQIPLPAGNVLETHFFDSENNGIVAAEVDVEPASVSDENYTMTVTSAIADHGKVYFDLFIQPKNEQAIALCESKMEENGEDRSNIVSLLQFRNSWFSSGSSSVSGPYDSERGGWNVSVDMQMGFGLWKTLSIRFDCMEEGLWLKMPVHQIKPIKLKINATAPGMGTDGSPEGGPVTLEEVKLSPLSIWLKYRSPVDQQGRPVVYFLWKDGTFSSFTDLRVIGPSGSGAWGKEYFTAKEDYKFGSVQDITKMEAIVFGDMAYPLDGGAPYEVDASSLPLFPFAVPVRQESDDMEMIPFLALCEGLGVPCEWDEEARSATAAYRGVTLVYVEGLPSERVEKAGCAPEEMALDVPPVFAEGDLWVCVESSIWAEWSLGRAPIWKDVTAPDETGSPHLLLNIIP